MSYQNIDKKNYRLAHFLPDSGVNGEEYVVILSPGVDVDDYLTDGFTVNEVFAINGNCSTMPTDRELWAN